VSDSNEKNKTTVFIEPDLLKRVKVRAVEKDLKFQQVVGIALQGWLDAIPEGASPLMNQLLKQQPTGADEELIRRFLAFWKNPKGKMEPHIRDLVAKALGVDPPK
jgi:hypothetical protein